MLFKIFLLLGFLASAFIFFQLVKDDIKLVSLRIKEETILDMFFLISIGSVVGARFVYLVSHFDQFGANPLTILLVTYFPGLSWNGALLGGTLFLWRFLKGRNILKMRIFDLATLSLFPILLMSYLGSLKLVEFFIFAAVVAVMVIYYNNPRRFGIRLNFPGAFFMIFVVTFSLVHLALDFATGDRVLVKLLTVEQFLSIGIFVIGLFFLLRGLMKDYV